MEEFLEPSPEMRRMFLKCEAEMTGLIILDKLRTIGSAAIYVLEQGGKAGPMGGFFTPVHPSTDTENK